MAAATRRAKRSSCSGGILVIGPATEMAAMQSPARSKIGAATDATPGADSSKLTA